MGRPAKVEKQRATLVVFAVGLFTSCARAPRHPAPSRSAGETGSQQVVDRDHEPRTESDRQTDTDSQGRATPFHTTADRPVSTFSIDVDTGS